MEFSVKISPITQIVVRGKSSTEVVSRQAVETVRVVQSSSPLPVSASALVDGGNF